MSQRWGFTTSGFSMGSTSLALHKLLSSQCSVCCRPWFRAAFGRQVLDNCISYSQDMLSSWFRSMLQQVNLRRFCFFYCTSTILPGTQKRILPTVVFQGIGLLQSCIRCYLSYTSWPRFWYLFYSGGPIFSFCQRQCL